MPEITAEQLAARKHHSITVLGERCYIWAVTQAEHELILAALREHEVRAAGEMAQYLTDAREFSSRTFGPGKRTGGVTQHIEKELAEIREKPDDLTEWVDVIILACDGYWRHGGQPENLMADIRAKLEKNKRRVWPTPTSDDVAIEHDRTHDAAVEKVVTSSLVRCDCVDANGNAWPDCTCDHGWRQAAVEKAVRNG